MNSTKKNTFRISSIFILSFVGFFPVVSYPYDDYDFTEDISIVFSDELLDAETQWHFTNNYINENFREQAIGNSQPNNNQITPNQEQKLTYQYSSDTHNNVRQRIINYFDTVSGGSALADVLRKTDLVEVYRREVHKQGFDKNSVIDADAYLWLQAWQTIHYTDETTITPEVIEAVRGQFRAIGIDRNFHELRDDFKQIYAEMRITQAMLINSILQYWLQTKDQTVLANMMQAARGSVEGIDNYKLTNKGFDVKKETLTPEGAKLSDIFINQLSSVTILKNVEKKSNVFSTVVVVKTANDQWFQRHAGGSFSVWDLQLASLKNNIYSGNSSDRVVFDIAESIDLSSVPSLFPLTVYIGNIYDNGQLNWGYFEVIPL